MRVKLLSAAVIAACAQGAFAGLATNTVPGDTLYGGGATFPAAAYGGTEWLTGPNTGTASAPVYASIPTTVSRLITGGAKGSYMAAYSNNFNVKPYSFVTTNAVNATALVPAPSALTALVAGRGYKIAALGDTTTAQWQSLGVTSATPAVGDYFVATGASVSGTTGTALIQKTYKIVSLGATVWSSVGFVASAAFPTPAVGATFIATANDTGNAPLAAGSADAYERPAVSYCQTGSGGGKNVLIGVKNADSVAASGNASGLGCGNFNTSVIPFGAGGGFGAPAGKTFADFVGSDSPITSSEYSTYLTNKGATFGVPTQMPVLSGAIGIVFNNPQTGKTLGATPLAISMTTLCGIFKGTINNWSQLGFPAKDIKVVYRSDSSGTSFALSNALSAMCPAAGVTGFSTKNTMAQSFPSATAPTGSISASGNNGVIEAVAANDGAIGYGDVNDALARAAITPSLVDVNFFGIKALDGTNPSTSKLYKAKTPLKVGKTFKLPAGAVVFDQAITGTDGTTGRPTLGAITGVPAARANCIALVKPDSYGNAATVSGDYSAYPLQAVTYMLFNAGGNKANALNLRQWMGSFFGATTASTATTAGTVKGDTTSISSTQGFSYLAGYSPTAQINSCITL